MKTLDWSYYYLRRRRRWCFYFGLFVCPSDYSKSCERILTKFLGGVGHDPGTKWLNFGDDPDPGIRSPTSGFIGLSKKYLVDSDQSCIANLHCKNHSAILLCWRSVEVCALWLGLLLVWLFMLFSTVTSYRFHQRTENIPLAADLRPIKMWQIHCGLIGA